MDFPQKDKRRAKRRQQKRLRYKKELEKVQRWSTFGINHDYAIRWAQIHTDTRSPCSCPGCGNPRRHFGKVTLQERKHEYDPNSY